MSDGKVEVSVIVSLVDPCCLCVSPSTHVVGYGLEGSSLGPVVGPNLEFSCDRCLPKVAGRFEAHFDSEKGEPS